jgi:hypothetical protein
MSFRNPTQLRLGLTGTFFNRTYRVMGRAVLGVIEGGRAYYWNEFYLESAGGGPATLVFEETETGCAWRLFTMFDPPTPMTAAEAEAKRQGDPVTLDGAHLLITRVDRSQVYYVEGKTPEGIETGKVARYFNADAGSREIVVSWTGEEVEYYSGMTTSAPLVAAAFKLQGFAAWRFMASKGRSWWSAQIWVPALLVLALVGIPLSCFMGLAGPRPAPVVTLLNAPASPLRVGATGILNDETYTIIGHALVEIAEMGRRWQRHEYHLKNTDNKSAQLVCETVSNAPAWVLYLPQPSDEELAPTQPEGQPRLLQPDHGITPLPPDDRLTPLEAGAMRAGQNVKIAGSVVQVRELFRSTVRWTEGVSKRKAGDVCYGLTGLIRSHQVLVVRWNQTNVIYWLGTPVPAKTVLAAFGPMAGNQAPR